MSREGLFISGCATPSEWGIVIIRRVLWQEVGLPSGLVSFKEVWLLEVCLWLFVSCLLLGLLLWCLVYVVTNLVMSGYRNCEIEK